MLLRYHAPVVFSFWAAPARGGGKKRSFAKAFHLPFWPNSKTTFRILAREYRVEKMVYDLDNLTTVIYLHGPGETLKLKDGKLLAQALLGAGWEEREVRDV